MGCASSKPLPTAESGSEGWRQTSAGSKGDASHLEAAGAPLRAGAAAVAAGHNSPPGWATPVQPTSPNYSSSLGTSESDTDADSEWDQYSWRPAGTAAARTTVPPSPGSGSHLLSSRDTVGSLSVIASISSQLRLRQDSIFNLTGSLLLAPVKDSGRLRLCKVSGCTFVNQYMVVKYLGRGSSGRVFLCMSIEDHRLYAVKVRVFKIVKKDQAGPQRGVRARLGGGRASSQARDPLDDLRREIQVMRRALHPNVVALREVVDDSSSNKMLLVMDYLEGGPVMTREGLERGHRVPEDVARLYFRDMCKALGYLHSQRVVHGDLKPENALMGAGGRVALSDFGCSKLMAAEDKDGVFDRCNGTPAFLAPEMMKPHARYRGRPADVYALGGCLYAFVFGRIPFKAETVMHLFEVVQSEPVTFPAEVPASEPLQELLLGMLEKDPGARLTLPQVMAHPWMDAEGALRPLHPPPARRPSVKPRHSDENLPGGLTERQRSASQEATSHLAPAWHSNAVSGTALSGNADGSSSSGGSGQHSAAPNADALQQPGPPLPLQQWQQEQLADGGGSAGPRQPHAGGSGSWVPVDAAPAPLTDFSVEGPAAGAGWGAGPPTTNGAAAAAAAAAGAVREEEEEGDEEALQRAQRDRLLKSSLMGLVSSELSVHTFNAGEALMLRGQPGAHMFYIIDGECEVHYRPTATQASPDAAATATPALSPRDAAARPPSGGAGSSSAHAHAPPLQPTAPLLEQQQQGMAAPGAAAPAAGPAVGPKAAGAGAKRRSVAGLFTGQPSVSDATEVGPAGLATLTGELPPVVDLAYSSSTSPLELTPRETMQQQQQGAEVEAAAGSGEAALCARRNSSCIADAAEAAADDMRGIGSVGGHTADAAAVPPTPPVPQMQQQQAWQGRVDYVAVPPSNAPAGAGLLQPPQQQQQQQQQQPWDAQQQQQQVQEKRWQPPQPPSRPSRRPHQHLSLALPLTDEPSTPALAGKASSVCGTPARDRTTEGGPLLVPATAAPSPGGPTWLRHDVLVDIEGATAQLASPPQTQPGAAAGAAAGRSTGWHRRTGSSGSTLQAAAGGREQQHQQQQQHGQHQEEFAAGQAGQVAQGQQAQQGQRAQQQQQQHKAPAIEGEELPPTLIEAAARAQELLASLQRGPREFLVAIRGPGDFVGEIEALSGSQSRRVASVVAVSSSVQAAVIPYATAKAYLGKHPLAKQQLAQLMWLRQSEDIILEGLARLAALGDDMLRLLQ